MLDLNSLAEDQARNLNQDSQEWRSVLWSHEFQRLSQSMTDGEVETLVTFSPSAQRLIEVVRFLSERSSEMGTHPFTVLIDMARQQGVSPAEWIMRYRA